MLIEFYLLTEKKIKIERSKTIRTTSLCLRYTIVTLYFRLASSNFVNALIYLITSIDKSFYLFLIQIIVLKFI